MLDKQKIETFFHTHRDEIIHDIKRLVRIKSTKSAACPNMPYGEGPAAALSEMLKLAQEYGFQTQDFDHCVGIADLNDVPRGLDILAHLDVVAADEPWTVCEPFSPCEKEGQLYGRGVADDKGPAIIALYAMRAIKEAGIPLKKGVRLVFGTDEECGSSDLPHYYDKVPEAEMTISPDADFPLVHGEKGRIAGEITGKFAAAQEHPCIISIQAGAARNAIPGIAHAVLEGCHFETVVETCSWHETRDKVLFTVTPLPKHRLSIQCEGTGAHAATPKAGNNALTALLDLIHHLPLAPCDSTKAIRHLSHMFPHGDYRGAAMKIAMRDDAFGSLTMCLNTLSMDATHFSAGFDCRTPLCAESENLEEKLKQLCIQRHFELQDISVTHAHYVDPNSSFIRTLLAAYEKYTDRQDAPICIGGGTYVHDLKNGVAFGCALPGRDNHMHGVDEYIEIEEMLQAGMIYTQAILDLCC